MKKESEEKYIECINRIMGFSDWMKNMDDPKSVSTSAHNLMINLALKFAEIAYHEEMIDNEVVQKMIKKYHTERKLIEVELGITREVLYDGISDYPVGVNTFMNGKKIDNETYKKIMRKALNEEMWKKNNKI